LEYLLFALAEAGCTDLFVTLGYAGDQISNLLTTLDVSAQIVPVQASEWKQGPLASFQATLSHIALDEPLLLVPGDLYISSQNLQLLIAQDLGVALLFDSTKHRPGTLIRLDSSQYVCDITQSVARLADFVSGVPALRVTPEFLARASLADPKAQGTVFSLLDQWLESGQQLQGVSVVNPNWCDIDFPNQLLDLNHFLLSKAWPPQPMPSGTYVPSDSVLEGPFENGALTLGESSEIQGPTLIGLQVEIADNCLVRGGAALGAGTRVQANSELTDCITFPLTLVPSNAIVNRAVLGAQGLIVHAD
jgi:NDP-sugar pyrophosphorylase family protein